MKKILLVALLAVGPGIASAENTAVPWVVMEDAAPLKQLFVDHSDLRDPFSVQFRRVQVRSSTLKDGTLLMGWCGEVNAKNAMGAYTGWHKFYAHQGMLDKPEIGIVDGASANAKALGVGLWCKGSWLDDQVSTAGRAP